jgi:hypothetical protein
VQKFDTLQVLGQKTKPEKIQQIAPGSATHFEQPQTCQIQQSQIDEEIGDGALALLYGQQHRRVERVVAPDITSTASVPRLDSSGFVSPF